MLDSFLPQMSESGLDFVRSAYGVLLLAHLLWTLPHARRYFLSERWGGYGASCPAVDSIQNPWVMPVVYLLWLVSAVCLALGRFVIPAAVLAFAFARYFHLHMRWKGVLRGMGAPGFMTCWLATAILALECCRAFTPSLTRLALLVCQVDFALIMFVAGWYKLNAGYASNEGMEYGMVNPQWGYWWRLYRRVSPSHWFFRLNNFMAWFGEVAAGILMLIPATRFWGAAFILLSFVYIGLNIRLLVLPCMVMLACVLFFAPDTLGGRLIERLAPPTEAVAFILPEATQTVGAAVLWTYLAILPVAYAGLFWNFYHRRALPAPWQAVLERTTNFFGLILWRVFSADLTHFYIRLHVEGPDGRRQPVGDWGIENGLRFSHVAEAITVTSLFSTLKYYPSNPRLFEERLLRYARTLPCPEGHSLVFEYVCLRKRDDRWVEETTCEFEVSPARKTVVERTIDRTFSARKPWACSPIHEASRPGSYAPAGS